MHNAELKKYIYVKRTNKFTVNNPNMIYGLKKNKIKICKKIAFTNRQKRIFSSNLTVNVATRSGSETFIFGQL